MCSTPSQGNDGPDAFAVRRDKTDRTDMLPTERIGTALTGRYAAGLASPAHEPFRMTNGARRAQSVAAPAFLVPQADPLAAQRPRGSRHERIAACADVGMCGCRAVRATDRSAPAFGYAAMMECCERSEEHARDIWGSRSTLAARSTEAGSPDATADCSGCGRVRFVHLERGWTLNAHHRELG